MRRTCSSIRQRARARAATARTARPPRSAPTGAPAAPASRATPRPAPTVAAATGFAKTSRPPAARGASSAPPLRAAAGACVLTGRASATGFRSRQAKNQSPASPRLKSARRPSECELAAACPSTPARLGVPNEGGRLSRGNLFRDEPSRHVPGTASVDRTPLSARSRVMAVGSSSQAVRACVVGVMQAVTGEGWRASWLAQVRRCFAINARNSGPPSSAVMTPTGGSVWNTRKSRRANRSASMRNAAPSSALAGTEMR